ncbi:MAG: ABC transporter ATP-binding protein [Alphaproteobacteria bacterium]|nr:ABC transporter ATP-binding protein [Alphaproteobacteria bacterium]
MHFRHLIIKTLSKHKPLYIIFAISFIFSSIALSIIPYVTSRLIGCFSEPTKEAVLHGIIFWLIVFAIAKTLQALNQYVVRIYNNMARNVLNATLLQNLFKTVHAHQTSYFDDEMTGRITTAVNKISGTVSSITSELLFRLIRPLINFLFALGIITYASPKLGITLIIICIPFYFLQKKIFPTIAKIWKQRGTLEREYTAKTVDSLTNYKLVRYTGSIFNERLNAYKLLKKYLRTTYDCETKRGASQMSLDLAESIFTISCYTAILYFTALDTLSLANAFFAFSAIHMLSQSIASLNDFTIEMSSSFGELSTNLELIYKPITIKDKENAVLLKVTDNSITYQNINFAYVKEKPVFQNFNLTIKPNQKVGLVGLSGAGKSTLISLLLRSYAPEVGGILIGKQNIADVTQYSLHKNIAYVPQDVTLFNRPLFENLQLANPKASKEEIIKAARLAHIHDTILNLPKGYDSIVGERGILLSGGERQRIAIARAILQNAPILILDEATSALDSEAEFMVQKALENLMKNKTVIAIAHRLSTLRAMDRILVLENGEIKEDGTPQELLKKKNGRFKHFYSLQTDGYLSANTTNKEQN